MRMCYVNTTEVLKLFKAYLKEYGDMISKDSAINELEDALASAECRWVEAEGEDSRRCP